MDRAGRSLLTITVLPKTSPITKHTFNFTHQTLEESIMEINTSSPRKRLLTDHHLNPNHTSITHSPESTLSFDSSSTKKTRDLPNLSDCHSCGVRINHTNPRDRLQPLDSIWRIVLLCKSCTKRVSCSDLCSYCFNSVVDVNDCVKCRDCHHSVHKNCVKTYELGLGFFVCVDCWIPDAIAKSVRARKRKKKKSVKLAESSVSVKESRRKVVLGIVASRKVVAATRSERKVVAAARCERKVVAAARCERKVVAAARPRCERKVAVAARCERKVAVAASCEEKVVDDAELAFLLHREINSSARRSRGGSVKGDDVPIACYKRKSVGDKVGLINSSGLGASLVCYSRREKKGFLTSSQSLNAPLMCYSRRRSGSKDCSHDTECERSDKHGFASSVGLNVCHLGSNSENSFSGNICQENNVGMGRVDMKPQRYLLKYHRIGKGKPRPLVFAEDSDSSCMAPDNLCTEGMTGARDFGNGNGCNEVSENCDNNTNRFLLKYKRSSRCKPELSCKVEEFSKLLPSNHRVEQTTLSNVRPLSS